MSDFLTSSTHSRTCRLGLTPTVNTTFIPARYRSVRHFVHCARTEVLRSVQRLGYRLDDRGVGIRVLVGARDFLSLFHNVQAGFGPRPASYKMGTGLCFPDRKEVGA
jgi:hypothetical protein